MLQHAMMEKSITLHVLMDEQFPVNKTVISGKTLFGSYATRTWPSQVIKYLAHFDHVFVSGLDGYTAYTKNDHKTLKGDSELKSEIKITKTLLGYCPPLALGSNGTLFTAKYLSDSANVKKFVAVFSKRVIMTMKPNDCQECECHSDNNGVPYYECISCAYPTPVNFDFVSLIPAIS